jgi:Fe-S cluster assembly ATP-binding protein
MHNKTKGSIIIISHQERILNIADKIVVVANGEIKQYGDKNDILPALLGKTATSCKALTDNI